jgi:asparagine synthase (glutamine-hydrolysing)
MPALELQATTSSIAGVLDYRRPFADGPLKLTRGADDDVDEPRAPVVCAIDGYIDNIVALAVELGLPEGTATARTVGIAYRRWGDAVLERLRGDYSLLVWDRERRRGLIACDHLGAVSVYVYSAGSRLYFASDLGLLVNLLPSRPAPDHLSVLQYVSLQSLTQSRTMYEGVVQLPPAHAIRFEDPAWRSFRYWAPRYQGVIEGSADELAEEVKRAISVGVERRLARTGLTAITMSGGMDSTTVAAFAQRLAPNDVRAYSTTMPNFPDEDESFLVQRMQEFTGISGRSFETRPRGIVVAGLRKLLVSGLPAISTTDFIRSRLYQAAREDGARIVLGGDGGDEVFATRLELIGDRVVHGRLPSAFALARRFPGIEERPPWHRIVRSVFDITYYTYRPPLVDDLERRARGPARLTPSWLKAAEARRLFDAPEDMTWKSLHGPRWWARLVDAIVRNPARVGLYNEMRRSGQAYGLDYRHPLLDFDLVDLTLRLPPELSYAPGPNRPFMRHAMRGLLPDEVRLRQSKTNFAPLALVALVHDRPIVCEVLKAPDAEINRYVDRDKLVRLLDGRLTGDKFTREWLDSVWRLFMAECWLRDQSDSSYSAGLLGSAEAAATEGSDRTFLDLVPTRDPA